jgi:DNA-binding Xre family transcriptional regulator
MRTDVQNGRPLLRHRVRPLVHGRSTNPKLTGNARLGLEVLHDVVFSHDAAGYPMGNPAVNDRKQAFEAGYWPMEEAETMGVRIRRLRQARNFSLEQLADKLISMGAPSTLTRAAISKWESGDTKNIQNATFVLLCRALVTDPEYLLWGDDRAPNTTRRAPPTQRREQQ